MSHLTRCASYARYSTDRQNPLSTEDQVAKSRQFAAEHNWHFLEENVYTDRRPAARRSTARGSGCCSTLRNLARGRSMRCCSKMRAGFRASRPTS